MCSLTQLTFLCIQEVFSTNWKAPVILCFFLNASPVSQGPRTQLSWKSAGSIATLEAAKEGMRSFSCVTKYKKKTLKCVSSRTPGRGKALSPRLMSTGRWPLCSALHLIVTLTSLSPLESRCNCAGLLTARSVSQWTSSTCPLTQMNTGWVRSEREQETCSRHWSWGPCCLVCPFHKKGLA